MTVDAGLRYPHLFAGLVGISGYVHEPRSNHSRNLTPLAKEQRLLVTHGTQDPIVPFAAARKQFQQLKAAGVNLEWHEFVKEHTIAGEAELSVIRDFIVAGYPAL